MKEHNLKLFNAKFKWCYQNIQANEFISIPFYQVLKLYGWCETLKVIKFGIEKKEIA